MGVKIHFLNVGSGDCTIIHFPARVTTDKDGNVLRRQDERIMMVDIYHREDDDEYENVIKYYKQNFKNDDGTIKPIFRFVCSHPHQDHICGLKKLFDDGGIRIYNFWDLDHSFEPEDFEGHPTHEEDWETYKSLGSPDSSATALKITREHTPRVFWNDDEDRITVLSPSRALLKYAHYTEDGTKRDVKDVEIDEMSYTLMIKINDRKIILAGDGRATPCWDDIYENCKDKIRTCSILKAGHHGHESAFHEAAVKMMAPRIIVFSNSEDEDKENGAEDLYHKAAPKALIFKTWRDGNITVDIPFDLKEPMLYSTSK